MSRKESIVINWPRAYKVFDTLIKALRNRNYPYNQSTGPHVDKNLPRTMPRVGVEHALFLFCTCYYMRGTINSETALIALSRVYDSDADLFVPKFITEASEKDSLELSLRLSQALAEQSLNYKLEETIGFWIKNSAKLHRYWDGDPRKLFENINSYEDIYDRIIRKGKFDPTNPNGFLCFQKKMASMIAFFLADSGIIPEFMFPVPIDFHAYRVLLATGILTLTGKGNRITKNHVLEELGDKARKVTLQYCTKRGVSPLRLCDCTWILSRTICAKYPGNDSSIGERQGRSTKVTPKMPDWGRGAHIKRYIKSCHMCPINKWCQNAVPSATYYQNGHLVIIPKEKHGTPMLLFN